jgi:hypothetical protein
MAPRVHTADERKDILSKNAFFPFSRYVSDLGSTVVASDLYKMVGKESLTPDDPAFPTVLAWCQEKP